MNGSDGPCRLTPPPGPPECHVGGRARCFSLHDWTTPPPPQAGVADVGGWISTEHDVPLTSAVEPNPAAAAAYDEAYALYVERGKKLFD